VLDQACLKEFQLQVKEEEVVQSARPERKVWTLINSEMTTAVIKPTHLDQIKDPNQ